MCMWIGIEKCKLRQRKLKDKAKGNPMECLKFKVYWSWVHTVGLCSLGLIA